jgi:CubicO group peptidase (beta-lactamase class C family)
MKTKKLIISFLAIAALVTAIAFIFRDKGTEVQKNDQFRLNDTLTNKMSDIPELEKMDARILRFMNRWQIKGASLAVTRNDSLLYAKGYGWADEAAGVPMEPGHILRMASVSKLLTAVGIMVLQDRDSLSIKDTVFGPDAILDTPFFNDLVKCDKNYRKITVEHLLRHQAGFRRDPLFSSVDVKNQLGLDHAPDKEDHYGLVLSRKLRWVPGTSQRYSNFGYLLLSEIIEKVSGMPYEQFMKEEVLEPAGCYDMHIGGIYYEDKRPNEVRYYTHEGDGKFVEDYTGNGNLVERCYGGTNLPLLAGAGAWCASPAEIARLVASIDGHPGVEDIISHESFLQMTEYFDENTFSLGWNDTNPAKGWNRTGTLAGTSALVRYYPDGECWIMITNTSTYRGPRFPKYTEALFKECRSLYGDKFIKKNMFE